MPDTLLRMICLIVGLLFNYKLLVKRQGFNVGPGPVPIFPETKPTCDPTRTKRSLPTMDLMVLRDYSQ